MSKKTRCFKYGITKIVGVGLSLARRLLMLAGCHLSIFKARVPLRLKRRLEEVLKMSRIRRQIFLKKFRAMRLKRGLSIGLVRALRRKRYLPVRGQRTRTNAKTVKRIKI